MCVVTDDTTAKVRRNPGRDQYEARLPDRERVKAEGAAFYGVPFTRPIRLAIEDAVRTRSTPLGRVSAMRAIHEVSVPGVGRVRVIYSSRRGEVVGVLPRRDAR